VTDGASGSPTARAAIFADAARYCSSNDGRHAQDVRNVVEAVAFVVGRQELGRIHLEGQQIADGVAVFGAVQTVDRRFAGVGGRERGLVQAPLEIGSEAVVGLEVRPRPAGRRHLPAPQLARDGLEQFGVRRDVVQVDVFEREAGLAARRIVAFEAVLPDDALVPLRQLLVRRLAARDERGRENRRQV
jgi:hypothetical protein